MRNYITKCIKGSYYLGMVALGTAVCVSTCYTETELGDQMMLVGDVLVGSILALLLCSVTLLFLKLKDWPYLVCALLLIGTGVGPEIYALFFS